MTANEVSAITGVSVRTLHHYDKIGLLCPARHKENSYRIYSEHDLDKLQQILFFKECGFPLKKIIQLLNSPTFDRYAAFALQKKYLIHEKKRISLMLETLNKTIKSTKGEIKMSQTEKFSGFDFSNNPYEAEARRLWGDDAVDKSKKHLKEMSRDEQGSIEKGMDELFLGLSRLSGEDPASAVAQAAIDDMYKFFNQNIGYHYSLEAFAGVGQLYITDPRFTENIDKYGEGLSKFLAEAMEIYAQNNA